MKDWSSSLNDETDWSTPLPGNKIPKKPQSLPELVKRYLIKEPVASLGQFGNNLLNIPSKAAHLVGAEKLGNKASFRPRYDYRKALGLPEEQNVASMAIELAPELMAAFALPAARIGKFGELLGKIPGAGKYVQKGVAEALPQAALAASMSDPSRMLEAAALAGTTQGAFSGLSQLALSPKPALQRLGSNLLGIGGGAATYYGLNQLGLGQTPSAVGGAIAGGLGRKFAGTKAAMMDELAHGKNKAQAEKRLKMAQRLNLEFLTPEEAFNSPFLARKQGQLGRSEEGSELLYEKFHKRVESEQDAINRVLKQIHDPDIMGPKATALYKQSYATQVPADIMSSIADNHIINQAIKITEDTPAYRQALKNVPTNTIEYLDHVKYALDDMIQAAPDKEARIIRETKNSLLEKLDNLSPEYKQGRALEERKFARKGLEEAFDKSNIRSGHAFYKALNSKEDFGKLMHSLRNVPIARAKLKAMRELFKDFRKESTINKVRGLEQTGMKQNRNDLSALKDIITDTFSGGKFDKQAIDFITSKDWDKQLAEINKISDKQKRMAKIIEVFGKGVAQGASHKRQPFLETENYEVYED